jgi:uncharacterized membrane protein
MTIGGVPLKLRSIGMGALIAVCLYISGLLVVLTPLPLMYVSATAGRRNGIAAALVSFILMLGLYTAALFSLSGQPGSTLLSIPLPGLGLVSHF